MLQTCLFPTEEDTLNKNLESLKETTNATCQIDKQGKQSMESEYRLYDDDIQHD